MKIYVDGTKVNAAAHKQSFGRTDDLPEETGNDLVKKVLQLGGIRFGLMRKDLQISIRGEQVTKQIHYGH
jgi:hypothetical protein